MAAIIFDFDGTIADSFDFVVDLLVREAGQPALTDEQRQALRGLSMTAIGRRLGHSWWRLLWLFFKGRRLMRGSIKHVQPFDGMPEVIKTAHAEGHELFILTSNTVRNVHIFLRHYRLQTYFRKVYGRIGWFNKTAALRRLLKAHKLELKNALYIGDELRDVQSAQALGLPVVAVTWGFARPADLEALQPTALAHRPADLAQIIKKL
jgi:phosphoglycolate phosphatase